MDKQSVDYSSDSELFRWIIYKYFAVEYTLNYQRMVACLQDLCIDKNENKIKM